MQASGCRCDIFKRDIFVYLIMSYAELHQRNELIAFIQGVEDQRIIDDICRMLKLSFDDSVFVTTPAQKQAIAAAQREIEEGKGITEEDADREIDEWLG